MSALQTIELELPPLPASIGRARDALSGLEDVPPEVHQSAVLVTSELVTNGIRHGSGDPGAVLTFRAQRFDGRLVLEVVNDATTGERPLVQAGDPLRSSGRGLAIVALLADRWGADTGKQTRVWCELAI
jgi:anti-sigma regulatory factor (Ser/Thr protein kinase)